MLARQPVLFRTNQPVLFRTNQPVLFRTNQPVLFRTSMFVCLFVCSVLSPVSSTSLWLGMGNVLTAKLLKLLFINNLSVYCLLLLLLCDPLCENQAYNAKVNSLTTVSAIWRIITCKLSFIFIEV